MLVARSVRVSTGITANPRLPQEGCGGVGEEGAGIRPCRGFGRRLASGGSKIRLRRNGGSRGLKAWFRDKLVLVSLAYYGYD